MIIDRKLTFTLTPNLSALCVGILLMSMIGLMADGIVVSDALFSGSTATWLWLKEIEKVISNVIN